MKTKSPVLFIAFFIFIGQLLSTSPAFCEYLDFYEGWDSLNIGYPKCENYSEEDWGFTNCAFTADSGQWLVAEQIDEVGIGSPIPSVSISRNGSGKISKVSRMAHKRFFLSIDETSILSFSSSLGSSSSHATIRVSFQAPASAPCPGTPYSYLTASITYVLADTDGVMTSSPCQPVVKVGNVSFFYRNIYSDFQRFLPWSPKDWHILQLSFDISGTIPDSTWMKVDNIKIARNTTPIAKKKTYNWLIVIDGMDFASSFVRNWPDMPTMYLFDAIPTSWKQDFQKKSGVIIPFAWSRDTDDTNEVVEQLYGRIKTLNERNESITILSHSWGTVLAYLALKKHDDIRIDKFITLGSPLGSDDLIVRWYTDSRIENDGVSGITKLQNLGEWHNYYSACDFISGPMSFLPQRDNYANNSIYLTEFSCHSSYFSDERKWDKILRDVAH